MYLSLLQQFGTALALAVLIGLEREQKKKILDDRAFAGVRTFSLIGLLGALAFYFMEKSALLFALIAGVVFALIISSYIVVAVRSGRIGLTTEIAAVMTFLIGGLCVSDLYVLAVSLALTTLCVLYFKGKLHDWAKNVSQEEIVSTIKFAIIAFIVLPLLPNQGYGPYEVFNPYIIWLMVVFVSGISFASYIAIKVVGPKKGIGITGFLAGLISSTALALSFSKESRENKSIVNPYVFAVVIATTAMFFRVLIEVAVLNRELVPMVAVPMLSMAVVGIISALVLWFFGDKVEKKTMPKLKSPFRLAPALQFGALFALILFIAKAGQVYFGHSGVYVVSLISGIVDMDAITVSMANLSRLSEGGISYSTATVSLAIAAFSNTLFKVGVFMAFGSVKAMVRILAVAGAMVSAGAVSLLFI